MPHFGLMDPASLLPAEAALQRARLHIRAGKRRLRQGKISAGLVTLYDAVTHALEWRYLSLHVTEGRDVGLAKNVGDDRCLFRILKQSGHIRGPFDYEMFAAFMRDTLDRDLPPDHPYEETVSAIERLMTELGVMPFNEEALPPEDPGTP